MVTQPSNEATPPSENIKQLGQVDQDVVNLLRYAGQAVGALTGANEENEDGGINDFTERKSNFTVAASRYFDALSSINIDLRRQIKALEKADILPAEAHTEDVQALPYKEAEATNMEILDATAKKQSGTRRNPITGGGLGNLDVGWLNSRNDNVERETEAEIWGKALQFTESLEAKRIQEQMKSENASH